MTVFHALSHPRFHRHYCERGGVHYGAEDIQERIKSPRPRIL